jgi:histidine triad (HIT) family protein
VVEGCVFCSIVSGDEPAEFVFQDESVVAIMDLHPATEGHVLVMPRRHARDLWEVASDDAERTLAASLQVASMIRHVLAPDGINLVHASGPAAWQTVFHFHLHVIPRFKGDSLVPPWPLDQPPSERSVLRALAERIRSAGELRSDPA